MRSLKQVFTAAVASAGIVTISACGFIPTEDQALESNSRRLTQGEIDMAQEVFGDEINYQRIFIKRMTTGADRSKVTAGRIIMTDQRYADDYSQIDDITRISVFFHEMTHIWQGQSDVSFLAEGINEFLRHGFDKKSPYKYSYEDLSRFEELGTEQQGKIVQNYIYWSLKLNEDNKEISCNQIKIHRNALDESFPDIRPMPEMCN